MYSTRSFSVALVLLSLSPLSASAQDEAESIEDSASTEESEDGLDRRPDHSDGPGNGSGKAKGHEKNGKSARETTETDDGEADVEP